MNTYIENFIIIYANEICNAASGKNDFFKRIFPKVKVVF